MIRRSYPPRIKGQLQTSPLKTVRLSPDAVVALAKLNQAIEARWGKDQAPSISMLISKSLNFYADRLTYSPERLERAYAEFVQESTANQL